MKICIEETCLLNHSFCATGCTGAKSTGPRITRKWNLNHARILHVPTYSVLGYFFSKSKPRESPSQSPRSVLPGQPWHLNSKEALSPLSFLHASVGKSLGSYCTQYFLGSGRPLERSGQMKVKRLFDRRIYLVTSCNQE